MGILPLDAWRMRSSMTIAELIPIAIQASLAAIVFCTGLKASLRDITSLLQRPGLLVRSLLAMNVIMPIFAAVVAMAFGFNRAFEVALIALAVSPVPPFLPNKQLKAGGSASYIIALLVIASAVAIVFVPAAVDLLGRVFGQPTHVGFGTVAKIVLVSVLVPIAAGIACAAWMPAVAKRVAKPLSIAATILLVVACVPVLVLQWPAIVALIGNFTVLAIILFVLFGLAAGHLLGGPDPDERTVLALATATRHPGVALAIVHDTQDHHTVVAAILLCFLVGAIASIPYVIWRKRSHARSAPLSRAA